MKTKVWVLGMCGLSLVNILFSQTAEKKKLPGILRHHYQKPSIGAVFRPSGSQKNESFNTLSFQKESALTYLPLREIQYQWNDTINNWAFMDSTIFSYYTTSPNKGKILESTRYNAMPFYKEFYRYNSNGWLTARTSYQYSVIDNTWLYSWKDTTVYNYAGKPLMCLSQHYSAWDSTWYTDSQCTFTYNVYGKRSEAEEIKYTYNPNPSVWWNIRVLYSYNSSQQVIRETEQKYDDSTSSYINQSRYDYFYDNNGKINKIIMLDWNTNTNKWDTTERMINITWYKWVSNDVEYWCNNLASHYEEQLRTGNGVYEKALYVDMIYDPIDDYPLEYYEYVWDTNTSVWVLDFVYKDILTRSSYYGNMITQIISQEFNSYTNAYKNTYKRVYKQPSLTYAENISIADNIWNIYPNPNNGIFKISLNARYTVSSDIRVVLTDVLGHVIMERIIERSQSSELEINVSDLKSSVYFMHIYSSDPSENKVIKVLVQRD